MTRGCGTPCHPVNRPLGLSPQAPMLAAAPGLPASAGAVAAVSCVDLINCIWSASNGLLVHATVQSVGVSFAHQLERFSLLFFS